MNETELEKLILAAREARAADALLPLLAETHQIYAGRSAAEADRIRGFILASFAWTGLPDAALPYVLEELETGRDAYTVAGAARALRGSSSIASEAPGLLKRAALRLSNADLYVGFDRLSALEQTPEISAVAELGAALSLAHRRGRCCSEPAPVNIAAFGGETIEKLAEVLFEDQDGRKATFADFFGERAALIAFFYTRCMNPEKCSLTVTKLGRVAKHVSTSPLAMNAVVAGISYDPEFDSPERLRAYGEERHVPFGKSCMLLRSVGPFEPLQQALQLAVGFGQATVNRHAIEVLLKQSSGAIRVLQRRRLWDEQAAFAALVDASDARLECNAATLPTTAADSPAG